ncbi:hypothetical protein Ahy_B08g091768 [Arachis hypogaea]|uniref:VQ domain-containing protein n=1 Tax=Arachis hypogaea TaxID=3818 RepID=A0A444Y2K9_ARAHY|nr:hypothetical protein Ahy_B08g091768 [Arachis hypogaea]
MSGYGGGSNKGPVKVVIINTQYVETDATSFKSVVQKLTGKDSSDDYGKPRHDKLRDHHHHHQRKNYYNNNNNNNNHVHVPDSSSSAGWRGGAVAPEGGVMSTVADLGAFGKEWLKQEGMASNQANASENPINIPASQSGRGVYRLKHHLAGTQKDVGACTTVSDEVKKQMWDVVSGLQVHTKRRNRLKAKTMNDVVFVMTNSRLAKKKQTRRSLDYDYSLDELDSDEEWIVADEDGEEEDLDALISDPDLNDGASGNRVVGASKDLLAIPYLDDDEFEELLQRPLPPAPDNDEDGHRRVTEHRHLVRSKERRLPSGSREVAFLLVPSSSPSSLPSSSFFITVVSLSLPGTKTNSKTTNKLTYTSGVKDIDQPYILRNRHWHSGKCGKAQPLGQEPNPRSNGDIK